MILPSRKTRHKTLDGRRPMTNPVSKERWTVAAFGAATVAAITAPVAARVHPALAAAAALAPFATVPWAARALPVTLDGVSRRRRTRSILWVSLALVGVVQMGRLSAFMSDATREWGATVP